MQKEVHHVRDILHCLIFRDFYNVKNYCKDIKEAGENTYEQYNDKILIDLPARHFSEIGCNKNKRENDK